MKKKVKNFDCIEMKRHIQEEIYEETRNMSREEYLTYIKKQVDESYFGQLLKKHAILYSCDKNK